ncbi:MAG: hypothetical protein QOG96_26 [Pseudonocardiales bacterium]|nr:hypothetical protein [Pseudonocardiales bacterium]
MDDRDVIPSSRDHTSRLCGSGRCRSCSSTESGKAKALTTRPQRGTRSRAAARRGHQPRWRPTGRTQTGEFDPCRRAGTTIDYIGGRCDDDSAHTGHERGRPTRRAA